MISLSARLAAVLVCVMAQAESTSGASQGKTPWGRETTDREGDFQRRLLETGRAVMAEQICRDALLTLPPGSDASAKWTIRLSRAMIRRATDARPIDPAIWSQASELLEGWLQGYESSRRAPWVRFARALVEFRRAQVASLELRAAPEQTAGRMPALTQLRRCEQQLDVLAAWLTGTIPLAELGRDNSLPPAAELRVLDRAVEGQQIRLLLARADLYPPDSDDALAAAVSAAQRARQLVSRTPADDAAFAEIARLEAESWLRVGQPPKALRAIQHLLPAIDQADEEFAGTAAPKTLAIFLRIAIAQKQIDRAERLVNHYYKASTDATLTKDATAAPPELDLARLELLLRDRDDLQAAADWTEAIEARHGRYHGRLASLKLIERDGIGADPQTEKDPRILAATAGAMLRRGEFAIAASQFAAAAQAARDASSRFKFELSAGAAYERAGNFEMASKHLAAAARELPQHKLAEAAHFQAALLLAKAVQAKSSSAAAEKFDELLSHHIRQWPAGTHVDRARTMLTERLENRGDWAAAARARAIGKFDPLVVAVRWRKALRQLESPVARDELAREAVKSLRSSQAISSQTAEIEASWIAAVWGDQAMLRAIGDDALARLRETTEPASIAWRARLAAQAIDLRQNARTKLDDQLIATAGDEDKFDLLGSLGAGAGPSGDNASAYSQSIAQLSDALAPRAVAAPQRSLILSALVGSGQIDKAISMVDRFPPNRSEPAIELLATMLLDRDEPSVKRKGIELLSRFGRGLVKGSDRWSAVQLQICRAMQQIGDVETAAKRANYILLTSPPKDAAIRAELRKFVPGDTAP